MKRRTGFAALLIAVFVLFSCFPAAAAGNTPAAVVLVAGSDYQYRRDMNFNYYHILGGENIDDCSDDTMQRRNTGSARVVADILNSAVKDGKRIDGLLYCGDYNYGYPTRNAFLTPAQLNTNISSLKNTVLGACPEISGERMVFVQGNHDRLEYGVTRETGLSESGANDCPEYGVFVIHEDSFPTYADRTTDPDTASSETAAALERYLSAKTDMGYTKPIFVLSHLPLHATGRQNGNDNMFAKRLFDVLNKYGGYGLHIVFLYGHNHGTEGYDDYIGGSAVCLTEGDTILIPQNSSAYTKKERLCFTYMNAGFNGYYGSESPLGSAPQERLTMSVFTVTEDTLTIERYNCNGKVNVKNAGTGSFVPKGYPADMTVNSAERECLVIQLNGTPQRKSDSGLIFDGINSFADDLLRYLLSDVPKIISEIPFQ